MSVLSGALWVLGRSGEPPMLAERRQIAQDTFERTPSIVDEHIDEGATLESRFINGQMGSLPPVTEQAPRPKITIRVVNADTWKVARDMLKDNPNAKGKIAVLNLASDERPGGGWMLFYDMTQEDALNYSSTLYTTLKEEYYPWPNIGLDSIAGIFSPGVVVFKDTLDNKCVDLPKSGRVVVSVLTVAAPRSPELCVVSDKITFQDPAVLECLQSKIRLIYRMAAHHGKEYLVLGALGCGAYRCPPRLVAEQMKMILLESEFSGRFKGITFAVLSQEEGSGLANFDIFKEILNGVVL